MSIYPGGVPHGPPGPPVPSEQGRVGILSRLPTLMTLPFLLPDWATMLWGTPQPWGWLSDCLHN